MTPGTFGRGFQHATDLIDNLEAAGVPITDAAVTTAVDTVTLTIEVEYSLTDPSAAASEAGQLRPQGGQSRAEPDRSTRATESEAENETVSKADPDLTTTATHGTQHVPTPLIRTEATATENPSADTEDSPSADAEPEDSETEPTSDSGSTEPVTTEGDGDAFTCTVEDCTSTFESEHGLKIHVGRVHGANHSPHRDPEILQDLYERYDTFDQMADAVESDVSAQTVRRQMIEHGIHRPGSNVEEQSETADREETATSPDGEPTRENVSADETPTNEPAAERASSDEGTTDDQRAGADHETPALANTSRGSNQDDGEGERAATDADDPDADADAEDGAEADVDADADPDVEEAADVGNEQEQATEDRSIPLDEELYEGITVGDLKCAVEGSATIFEVQRALGVDRTVVVDLLQQTELLDLVQGRAAQKFERDRMKAEIDERLAIVLAS